MFERYLNENYPAIIGYQKNYNLQNWHLLLGRTNYFLKKVINQPWSRGEILHRSEFFEIDNHLFTSVRFCRQNKRRIIEKILLTYVFFMGLLRATCCWIQCMLMNIYGKHRDWIIIFGKEKRSHIRSLYFQQIQRVTDYISSSNIASRVPWRNLFHSCQKCLWEYNLQSRGLLSSPSEASVFVPCLIRNQYFEVSSPW